jgi:hypothetical protein
MLTMGYLSTQVARMSVHSAAAQRQAFAFQVVLAVLVELAGRAVQAQRDLLAGGVAGLVDGLQDQLDGRFVAGHVGREAALVAHAGGHALGVR